MEILDLFTLKSDIQFIPKNKYEEILQNIKTILTTMKGSVPLDRDFGIDPTILDLPISIIKPLLAKEIKEAIEKFEPRAKFIGVDFKNGEFQNGIMNPLVKVVINE